MFVIYDCTAILLLLQYIIAVVLMIIIRYDYIHTVLHLPHTRLYYTILVTTIITYRSDLPDSPHNFLATCIANIFKSICGVLATYIG